MGYRFRAKANRNLGGYFGAIQWKDDGKKAQGRNGNKAAELYVNKELGRAGEYTRSEIHNKIDSLTKKGGYSINSTKRREKQERKSTMATLTLTFRLLLQLGPTLKS